MRTLKLAMQVSVDGCTAGADGDTRWMVWNGTENWPWDNRLRTYHNDLTLSSDCILLSRKNGGGRVLRPLGTRLASHQQPAIRFR
jgi:hypothetical protein